MTENFRQSEFTCRCGCGFNDISPQLVHRLQVLRDILGSPIRVTSGCRCPEHNANVGGSPGSMHTLGLAADVVPRGQEHFNRMAMLIENWSGGMKVYRNFIHLDLGARRRW